jgi:hypothetical protein
MVFKVRYVKIKQKIVDNTYNEKKAELLIWCVLQEL